MSRFLRSAVCIEQSGGRPFKLPPPTVLSYPTGRPVPVKRVGQAARSQDTVPPTASTQPALSALAMRPPLLA
jgi:hypothetical protein